MYMWELRKAGLTEFFENANLDKVYFDKLVKQFGKVPTRYPNRTGENWCVFPFLHSGRTASDANNY